MKNRGFTLLELLLVVSLLVIVFSMIGFTFVSNIQNNAYLSSKVNRFVLYMSIYNQIHSQLFALCPAREENIRIYEDKISLYTLAPLFYPGAVRAEYYIKKEKNKFFLIYEEFPYVDGRLGDRGLKKTVLGEFNKISFEVLDQNQKKSEYTGKKTPEAVVLRLDGEKFYIYSH